MPAYRVETAKGEQLPRLSNSELEAVQAWAETLSPERRAQVLWLVHEARDHRKLRGQLHADLINEMS